MQTTPHEVKPKQKKTKKKKTRTVQNLDRIPHILETLTAIMKCYPRNRQIGCPDLISP